MDKIITIGLVCVIAICGWSGYKKGMIMGIGGILAIIISIYGAGLLSTAFSHEVIPALKPFVSGYLDSQITTAVYTQLDIPLEDEEDTEESQKDVDLAEALTQEEADAQQSNAEAELRSSVNDLMEQNPSIVHDVIVGTMEGVGIFKKTAERLADDVEDYAVDNSVTTQAALSEVVCETVSFVIGYIIAFILIIILLTVLGNIPNFSFRLPNLDVINDTAGAVLGIVTGVLFCYFITWVMTFTGIIIDESKVMDSGLASLFINTNVITSYLNM